MLIILLVWLVVNLIDAVYPIKINIYILSKTVEYIRYAGYLLLGFYLSKHDFIPMKCKVSSGLVFILTITVCAVGTYFLSKNKGDLSFNLYSYLSANTIFQSIALFILAKNWTLENKIVRFIRDIVSDYSYGIYLTHIMVIHVFFLHRIFWTMGHPLITVPAITISVLIISCLVVFLLRKIPLGKYISG